MGSGLFSFGGLIDDLREGVKADEKPVESVGEKYITTTYEIVTPESAEEGDYAEIGWENEEGEDMTPDEYDAEEGITAVDKAVEFLKDNGPVEPSSSRFSVRTWYTHYGEQDWRDGSYTNYNYFLNGFSEEEEREIYSRVTGAKESRRRPVQEAPQRWVIASDFFGDDWYTFKTREAADAFIRKEIPKVVRDRYCDGGDVGVYGMNKGVPAAELEADLLAQAVGWIEPMGSTRVAVGEGTMPIRVRMPRMMENITGGSRGRSLREGSVVQNSRDDEVVIECGFAIITTDGDVLEENLMERAEYDEDVVFSAEDVEAYLQSDQVGDDFWRIESNVLAQLKKVLVWVREEGHGSDDALIGSCTVPLSLAEDAYQARQEEDPAGWWGGGNGYWPEGIDPNAFYEGVSEFGKQGIDVEVNFFDWPENKDGEPWNPYEEGLENVDVVIESLLREGKGGGKKKPQPKTPVKPSKPGKPAKGGGKGKKKGVQESRAFNIKCAYCGLPLETDEDKPQLCPTCKAAGRKIRQSERRRVRGGRTMREAEEHADSSADWLENMTLGEIQNIVDDQLGVSCNPESDTSDGGEYLHTCVSSAVEMINEVEGEYWEDATTFDGERFADVVADMISERADGLVPVYTSDIWKTFVDLQAWLVDISDYGEIEDMEKGAAMSLYVIAEAVLRGVAEKYTDWAEEYSAEHSGDEGEAPEEDSDLDAEEDF